MSLLYALLLSLSIYFEFYYVALLPLLLLSAWFILKFPAYVLIAISFFTPFSLNIAEFYDLPVGLMIPSEPMLISLSLLFLFLLLGGFRLFQIRMDHSLLVICALQILWMSFTALTSEMPLVSLKYCLARIWFVLPCLFFGVYVFRNLKHFYWFSISFIFSCSLVVIYTVTRHSGYGFDKDSAHWVMEPLFRDHTVYGAVLALVLPVNIGLLFIRDLQPLTRFLLRLSAIIIVLGTILSYTRAAWISLVVGFLIFLVMYFKLNVRVITMLTITAVLVLGFSWENLLMTLEKNKQESSDKLEEHIGSISNVSSDASNLERINRWNCAWQMFLERPITGWGPGTYQFVYAPFQMAKDRTIISTNQGDGGNAHSEYLGPLCEQGLAGFIWVIMLVVFTFVTAFRLNGTIVDFDTRVIVISCFIGLTTYFAHGLLNNFLDSDKASVPFWGYMAMLVSADLYSAKNGSIERRA
jgi:O-antigen ligase